MSMSSTSGKSIPHNEDLVRPETKGIPTFTGSDNNERDGSNDPELVFFNTFFCPYAQMAWIALGEKGVAHKTEFIEGLTIRGGDYEVHPRLRALGHSGVPTLYHPSTGAVVGGSTDCIKYIDKKFGEPDALVPKDDEMRERALRCERILHSKFTFQFYSMLLRQEKEEQEKAKKRMIAAIEALVGGFVGPYYLGDQFTIADISLAPYFDRMCVLDHYRDFKVPEEGPTAKWKEWSDNVLARESVAKTRQERERIIEAYLRYAKCYVRNNWYERVFYRGC